MKAMKQAQTEGILQRLDLPADGALRQAQFICCKRKAPVTRDSLEAVQQVQ